MAVVNFRKKGKILAGVNYVEISPIDKEVAAFLLKLADSNIATKYWTSKRDLDKGLAGLDKKGLEEKILDGKNPNRMPTSEFEEEFRNSVIYSYDAQEGLVRLTPTPFATGPDVQKYFAIKSPEYVG